MIKVYNKNLQLQAVLRYVISPQITEEINGRFTFAFSTVIDDEKSQYINENSIVEVENNFFNIVAYEKNASADGLTFNVECEHVSYDLLEDENTMEYFTAYGTPAQIMSELFQGTSFTVGTVEITTENYLSINEAITKRGALIAIAKTFNGELKFDKYQVSLLNRRGADRGVRFMYRKNLINCKYAVDAREKKNGLPTISVEVDVAELEFANGGMPDEHYELGDDVTVIHGPLKVNIPERIIQMSYNPAERMQGRVGIGNPIKDITDTIVNLQINTVKKDKVYNGCKIGPENGFEAIRSDNFVRSVLNATTGISIQKGDGSGNSWEDMFFVDTQGNQHMKNTYIELIGDIAKILLDPNVGIKISNDTKDIFFIDPITKKLNLKDVAIELTRSDGKTKVLIDPTNGNKIQKNTGTVNSPIWQDVNYQDADGNTILKGFIVASKFFGESLNSAFMEIGTGGASNLADLKLYRGLGTIPVFSIYDNVDTINLRVGKGVTDPADFLQLSLTNRYPKGTWNCSSALFTNLKDGSGQFYATENYVDNAIASAISAHIAADHSGT